MSDDIWKKIKNDIKLFGFKIDETFLDEIVNRDLDSIFTNLFFLPCLKIDSLKENFFISFKDINENIYKVNRYIGRGSFKKTYIVSTDKNKQYVYRYPIDKTSDIKILLINYIETFIHVFLYCYQKKYFMEDKFINVKNIGYNIEHKFIGTLIKKMDGNLYSILSNKKIEWSEKVKILYDCLIWICDVLENLQENLKFVHNDLKADNIFFKLTDKKYTFFIGDLDGVRLKVDNKVIIASTIFDNNIYFNKKKDLFILTNSLFFSFHDVELLTEFFNFFNLKEFSSQEEFHLIYEYEDDFIEDIYIPSNYKKIFNNNFFLS